MGFINVLVKPLYTEFCQLLGEPAQTDCLGALQSNLEGWEQNGNGLLKQMEVTPTLTPTLTLPLNLTLTLTVARRFVSEVDALIVDLQRTHTSFIRCVKPNRLGLGLRLGLRLG